MAGRKEREHDERHHRDGHHYVMGSNRDGDLGSPAWNVSYSVSCHGYCSVVAVKVMGSTVDVSRVDGGGWVVDVVDGGFSEKKNSRQTRDRLAIVSGIWCQKRGKEVKKASESRKEGQWPKQVRSRRRRVPVRGGR